MYLSKYGRLLRASRSRAPAWTRVHCASAFQARCSHFWKSRTLYSKALVRSIHKRKCLTRRTHTDTQTWSSRSRLRFPRWVAFMLAPCQLLFCANHPLVHSSEFKSSRVRRKNKICSPFPQVVNYAYMPNIHIIYIYIYIEIYILFSKIYMKSIVSTLLMKKAYICSFYKLERTELFFLLFFSVRRQN